MTKVVIVVKNGFHVDGPYKTSNEIDREMNQCAMKLQKNWDE